MRIMFFVVDAASPVGLADQLAAQIRGALADGRLRPGELVGSVVDLEGAIDALVAMDGKTSGASGIVVARP